MNVKDITKKNLDKILQWCKETYGESRFKNVDRLSVVINTDMDAMGSYCTVQNKIFINPKHHDSFIGVIDTMIHEYIHFKQDINVMYFKYLKEYTYNYHNHPYEITARHIADRDKRKCFKEVFHKTHRKDKYL